MSLTFKSTVRWWAESFDTTCCKHQILVRRIRNEANMQYDVLKSPGYMPMYGRGRQWLNLQGGGLRVLIFHSKVYPPHAMVSPEFQCMSPITVKSMNFLKVSCYLLIGMLADS